MMMRVIGKVSLLLSIALLLFLKQASAVSYPSPTGFVNDFADIYSSLFEKNLEENLRQFEATTSAEIAVATIKSLDDEVLEDFAVRLFERWQIGKKGTDDGLLLLIVVDDRDIRMEVGYGLEPYITDGRAGAIIREDIVPDFGNGQYEEGTQKGVAKIKQYIEDEDIAPLGTSEPVSGDSPNSFYVILIAGYFFIIYTASFLGRTKEIWPGGAIGATLGGIGGFLLASFVGFIIGAVFAAALGFLLDFILSKNYQYRTSRGLPTGFWHTRGGFSSGRSSSSGKQGFGGFGGGRSGGGGASGKW